MHCAASKTKNYLEFLHALQVRQPLCAESHIEPGIWPLQRDQGGTQFFCILPVMGGNDDQALIQVL